MANVEEFLSALRTGDQINAALVEVVREWGDDCPATLLFAAIGRAIADNFRTMEPNEAFNALLAVEEAIKGDDTGLRTYVATGLLEALYSRSQSLGSWDVLSPVLGVASRRYIDEWTGCPPLRSRMDDNDDKQR